MPNSFKDAFATTTKEESFALADPGAKYQATDVIESPTLPFRRLVFAGRCEDRWFIYYEHGGRGHSYAVLVYRADANHVPRLDWGGAGFVLAKGLDDLREAVATGKFADISVLRLPVKEWAKAANDSDLARAAHDLVQDKDPEKLRSFLPVGSPPIRKLGPTRSKPAATDL
jgi:hypothetical protein